MKRLNERGQMSLTGVIIGALVLVLLGFVAFRAYESASAVTKSQTAIMRGQFAVNHVWGMMQSDANSAESIFIPSHDLFGAANGYTWGDTRPLAADTTASIVAPPASTGHEIDFYGKDAQHHPHFWAYVFRNGTLSEYPYGYRDSNGIAQGVGSTPTWSMPAASFQSYYLYETQLPAVDKYIEANVIARGIAIPPDVLTQLPYPEVIAGNRITVYDMVAIAGNAQTARHVELAGGAGGGVPAPVVKYTARPPSGFSVSPTTLTLGYQGAQGLPSSGAFSASADYYHGNFVLGPCSVATVAQTGQQLTIRSDVSSFSVTPTAVGACVETVTTQDGPQPSGNVQITVEGQLAVSPASLVFTSPTAPSQVAKLFELGYAGAFSVASNGCNGYAQLSGGGNGPGPTPVSIQPTASTAALPGGACTIVFSDFLGAQGSLTVTVDPLLAATPTPTPTPRYTWSQLKMQDSQYICGGTTTCGITWTEYEYFDTLMSTTTDYCSGDATSASGTTYSGDCDGYQLTQTPSNPPPGPAGF